MRGQLIIIIINHHIWSGRKFDDVLALSNQFLPGEDTLLGANLEFIWLKNLVTKQYECK